VAGAEGAEESGVEVAEVDDVFEGGVGHRAGTGGVVRREGYVRGRRGHFVFGNGVVIVFGAEDSMQLVKGRFEGISCGRTANSGVGWLGC